MFDKWRAAIASGLAEAEELAEAQQLDTEGRHRLQERSPLRRVEQLVTELPGAPALVQADAVCTRPGAVVVVQPRRKRRTTRLP
jgi:hypothetical protein